MILLQGKEQQNGVRIIQTNQPHNRVTISKHQY